MGRLIYRWEYTMAGGTMTILVPNYAMLQQVAQRVTCWAGGVGGADNRRIQINSWAQSGQAIVIPEEIFAAHGALTLEPGGADILSGYVAGTNVTFDANNGTVAFLNPNTCTDNTDAPQITNVTMNVGGNPKAINLAWINATGAGTVNITWGDGTATNGAAEASNANHTYPYSGVYTIRVTDASVASAWTETTVYIP
jgi:hypothetical protein